MTTLKTHKKFIDILIMAPKFRPNPKAVVLLQALVLTTTTTLCSARLEHSILTRPRHHTSLTPGKSRGPSLERNEASAIQVRGGQSSSAPNGDPYANYADYNNPSPPYENDNPEQSFANYNPPAGKDFIEAEHLFQESVQDRVDRWRQMQMEQQSKITPEQELNPRDGTGRMKLISSVSRGSRALIFFIVMWRDIHLFEVADASLKGFARTVVVMPMILLFIGNMAGVVASFTSPSHANKKRMKAILNLDKLVEGVLLVWYFIRLTIAPSKYVPREVFVAKTLHSVLFLVQLQAFTRVTW